jgi:hypothetical protein
VHDISWDTSILIKRINNITITGLDIMGAGGGAPLKMSCRPQKNCGKGGQNGCPPPNFGSLSLKSLLSYGLGILQTYSSKHGESIGAIGIFLSHSVSLWNAISHTAWKWASVPANWSLRASNVVIFWAIDLEFCIRIVRSTSNRLAQSASFYLIPFPYGTRFPTQHEMGLGTRKFKFRSF